MGIYNISQITDIIINNPNKEIVDKAKNMRKVYTRHTHGVNFKELLKRDEYVADTDCFESLKKSAVSNKDLMKRLLNEESQVFSTTGGSAFFGLNGEQEKQMNGMISDVIHGMSIYKWVQTYALDAYRSDPMSLIFMEVDETKSVDGVNFNTPRCYPTYKCSDEIHDYLPNGTNLDYVCFKLTEKQQKGYGVYDYQANINLPISQTTSKPEYYRFVDDNQDTIYKRVGKQIILANTKQQNPIYHNFGRVPAFIVSDLFQYDDPKCFGSPLQFVIELADVFFNDRSVRNLHKKLHGFPKAVEPYLSCPTCFVAGQGSTGLLSGKPCPSCTPLGGDIGTGYRLRTMPSDVARFPLEMLKETGSFKVSDIFMYVTPDIEGFKLMNDGLISSEDLIYCTYWGVQPETKIQSNGSQDIKETATKTVSNLQPKYSRLNQTADWTERSLNKIADFIGVFWFNNFNYGQSNIRLSRNYILEMPEDILAVYHTMLAKGTPDVELDNQFKRYLMALYRSNQEKKATSIKMYELQPFPHKKLETVQMSDDVTDFDKLSMLYFGEWSRSLTDIEKSVLSKERLKAKFDEYINAKMLIVEQEEAADMEEDTVSNETD